MPVKEFYIYVCVLYIPACASARLNPGEHKPWAQVYTVYSKDRVDEESEYESTQENCVIKELREIAVSVVKLFLTVT